MVLKLSIVCLALLSLAFALSDSDGQEFFFSFVRNADQSGEVPHQILSITVLNGGDFGDANVTLSYRESYDASLSHKTVTVASLAAVEIPIPSFYGWPYVTLNSPQYQFLPHDTLYVQSSTPVTILANNYDNQTGKGETFRVLPKIFGGLAYSFTLPPVFITGQYQQVTFLPTQGSANITLRIPGIGSLHKFTVNDLNGTSYIALKSPTKSQSVTYHITSDAPIQIVAGVTCNGISIDTCDHVCYMPQPLASSACFFEPVMQDDHISELLDNQFYADISGTCSSAQTVSLSDGSITDIYSISPQEQNQPISTSAIPSTAIYLESTTAALHVTKYFDGNNRGIGSYITTVPSLSQMITSTSFFYTRGTNSVITVTCARMACNTLYLDGTLLLANFNYTLHGKLVFGGESFYTVSQTVVDPGFHQLYFREEGPTKQYAYVIKSADNRYGYTGPINVPSVNITIPPSTSPAPTTTSQTAAPTTSKSPTPTRTTQATTGTSSTPPSRASTASSQSTKVTSSSTMPSSSTVVTSTTGGTTGKPVTITPANSETSSPNTPVLPDSTTPQIATKPPPNSASSNSPINSTPDVSGGTVQTSPSSSVSTTVQSTTPLVTISPTTSSSPIVTRLLCVAFLVLWL